MIKKSIRQSYLKKRKELTASQLEEFSQQIVTRFCSYPVSGLTHLFSYYALVEKAEFNVEPCTSWLRERNPDMVVSWPRIDPVHNTMEALTLAPNAFFSKNQYNILEPISGDSIAPEGQDIVFVPLVAFDLKGYRVGYGKGYYDRYLGQCRPDCIKMGFSFFDPVEAISDIGEFDVPLSVCITPSRIYEF